MLQHVRATSSYSGLTTIKRIVYPQTQEQRKSEYLRCITESSPCKTYFASPEQIREMLEDKHASKTQRL